MATGENDALEKRLRIAARPEIVFSYFTDPDKLVKWQGVWADLEARPGGHFRLDHPFNPVRYRMRGEYLEVTPYTRVVFTYGWEGEGSPVPPGSTVVEVTLTPDGDATLLVLRHLGLPSAEEQRMHSMGWQYYLGRLVEVAEGRDPGPQRFPK